MNCKLKIWLWRRLNGMRQAGWFLLYSALLFPALALAGDYADSAHGNSTYGVDRNSIPAAYVSGNCSHCHEQHASIGGTEPAPTSGGPSIRALFCANQSSQNNNFCFKCHDATSTVASSAIINRSYSYRAGGWTSDTVNDIEEIFNLSGGSAHALDDIVTFINGKWGYTSANNPCAACHNPHAVQGDPANAQNVAKSITTRGYPVSRSSQHGTLSTWGLWGDDAGEKMSDYSSNYQAPYRFSSGYEPDGSATTNGSNLTDFNTFCSDCHNASNTIFSTALGRNLKYIDWDIEKHGRGNADVYISVDAPFTSGSSSLGYVLACTDCHEPHGSANAFLIRKEVNGGLLSGSITSFTDIDWHHLCDRCHKDDKELNSGCQEDHYYYIHHTGTGDPPYAPGQCKNCHSGIGGGACTSGFDKFVCTNCHFHGSWVNDPANPLDRTPNYAPTTRRTF